MNTIQQDHDDEPVGKRRSFDLRKGEDQWEDTTRGLTGSGYVGGGGRAGKEKRPLGIPTVRDRVVQTLLRAVVEPIFEREFAPQSYGFRPGRGCKDALRRVDELLKSGHVHVVDIDIKGLASLRASRPAFGGLSRFARLFDSIPHDRLVELVEKRIADGRVLGMIEGFLKAGVMEGMESWEVEKGTPQGGVISPFLANIYLNPLDWLMEQSGLEMVRYADDMVVLILVGGPAAGFCARNSDAISCQVVGNPMR